MSHSRHSFGKFILGAAAVGAAAYGVYRILERRRKILEADEADFEEDAAAAAPQEKAAGPEDFEPEEEMNSSGEEERYASVDFRQAADRAYTTIQHGSQEAMGYVKEAVGPKGAEVIDTVGAAAGEVGRTVAASAARIIDILAQPEPAQETFYTETPAPDGTDGPETDADGEPPVYAQEAEDAAVSAAEEIQEEAPVFTESPEAEEPQIRVTRQEADPVEDFFDDDAV